MLGNLGESKLHVNQDISKREIPCKKLLIALQNDVRQELDRLVQVRALIPMEEPKPWVNQMAVVKKSDGITDLITALTSKFARKSSKVQQGLHAKSDHDFLEHLRLKKKYSKSNSTKSTRIPEPVGFNRNLQVRCSNLLLSFRRYISYFGDNEILRKCQLLHIKPLGFTTIIIQIMQN